MTRRQRDLLEFIRAYKAEHGTCPSFDEMKDAIGLKSKSGIFRLLDSLAERGYVSRLRHRARAIELLDDGNAAITAARKAAFNEGYSKGYRAGLVDRRAA